MQEINNLELSDIKKGTIIQGTQEKYIVLQDKPIGKGTYGQVFLGLEQNKKRTVAIKAIDKIRAQGTIILDCYEREKENLKKINSSHIIKLYDDFETNFCAFLIMEYCNGGTLKDYINQNQFTEHKALVIINQILAGLKGLYKLNISHRDLKPDNIMFHNGVLKIIDLGASKQAKEKDQLETLIGSFYYMAPEILLQMQKTYDQTCDIYSLGVLVCEMLFDRYPYDKINKVLDELKMKKQIYKLSLEKAKFQLIQNEKQLVSGQFFLLLQRMVELDPKNRLQFGELFKHDLIKEQYCHNNFHNLDLQDLVEVKELEQTQECIKDSFNDISSVDKIESILYQQYNQNQIQKQSVINAILKIINEININNQLGLFIKQQSDICLRYKIYITYEYSNFYVLKIMLNNYTKLKDQIDNNLESFISKDKIPQLLQHKYFQKLQEMVLDIIDHIKNAQLPSSQINIVGKIDEISDEDSQEIQNYSEFSSKSEIFFKKYLKIYFGNLKEHELNREKDNDQRILDIQKHMTTIIGIYNLDQTFRQPNNNNSSSDQNSQLKSSGSINNSSNNNFDFIKYQLFIDKMNLKQREEYLNEYEYIFQIS